MLRVTLTQIHLPCACKAPCSLSRDSWPRRLLPRPCFNGRAVECRLPKLNNWNVASCADSAQFTQSGWAGSSLHVLACEVKCMLPKQQLCWSLLVSDARAPSAREACLFSPYTIPEHALHNRNLQAKNICYCALKVVVETTKQLSAFWCTACRPLAWVLITAMRSAQASMYIMRAPTSPVWAPGGCQPTERNRSPQPAKHSMCICVVLACCVHP